MDLTRLLEPTSDGAPSGENLEYDPAFAELEKTATFVPEQEYGDTIIPAKEPEWDDVLRQALALAERTKDLRVGLYLVRAGLKVRGLTAMRDGLALLRGYVDSFWETVHPQLDPDDDNDPAIRVNTLSSLCDNGSMLQLLRTTPIVRSRAAGQFSRRDIALATGEIQPPRGQEDSVPKMSTIDAAFQDCDLGQLTETTRAAVEAIDHVKGIERSVTMQVGAGSARSLETLVKELESLRKILLDRLTRRGGSLDASEAPAPGADATPVAADAASQGDAMEPRVVRTAPDWNAEITTRADAIRAIEKASKYFLEYEPSSPLPLLLQRALRLSTKSFLEILRDISPDGLSQAESLGGSPD